MSVRVKFESRLPQLLARQHAAARKALEDIGGVWQGMATLRTPVDSGVLRASLAWAVDGDRQHRQAYRGNERVPAGIVDYTASAPPRTVRVGSNTAYALFVHENLTAYHKVGEAKFIEGPLRQNSDKWIEFIARKVGEAAE